MGESESLTLYLNTAFKNSLKEFQPLKPDCYSRELWNEMILKSEHDFADICKNLHQTTPPFIAVNKCFEVLFKNLNSLKEHK